MTELTAACFNEAGQQMIRDWLYERGFENLDASEVMTEIEGHNGFMEMTPGGPDYIAEFKGEHARISAAHVDFRPLD